MLNHMDAKGLTKMDEKLEDAIKKLEVDISIISKTKISDADLDIKIDALVNLILDKIIFNFME